MPGPVIVGTAVPIRGGALGSGAGLTWVDPVINRTTSTPPGSPTPGDRYIVAATATGAWAGKEDSIADWNGATWEFTDPVAGLTTYVTAETEYFTWNGSAWVQESFGPHATTHEKGGTDEVTLENLLTASVAGQVAVSKADGSLAMKKFYIVEPTDDFAATMNAIGSNSFVWLADGQHDQTAQIDWSAKTNMEVAGSKSAKVNVTWTSGNDCPWLITAPCSDITFRGFSIDYNGTAGGPAALFQPSGTGGAVNARLAWKDITVRVDNGGSGGTIMLVRNNGTDADINGLVIEGCTITGADTRGLLRFDFAAGRTIKHVQVLGNRVERDAEGGVASVSCFGTGALLEDLVVQGNTFTNLGEPVYISCGATVVRHVLIEGNTFKGGGGSDGVRIEGSGLTAVLLEDNTFDDCGSGNSLQIIQGTFIKCESNIILNSKGVGLVIGANVSNSAFENNTITGSASHGIQSSGNDNDVRVNTCRDNTGWGLIEPSATDGCSYFGNTVEDNTAGDVSMHASSTNRTRLDRTGDALIHEGLLKDQQQILYVGKHGSDSNSGKTLENAFLTFGAAKTAAGTPASEAAAITISCFDDGEYDEDLTHTQYVNVFAPNATIKGKQTLARDSRLVARRFINDGNNEVIVRTVSAGECYVEAQEIVGSGTGVNTLELGGGGNTHIIAKRIQATGNGNAINQTAGNLFLNSQWISAASATAFNMVAGGNSHIISQYISGGTGIKLTTATSIARIFVGQLAGGYDVGASTTLYLYAEQITGTITENGTANVTISGKPNESIVVACSDEVTPLVAGTGKVTFRMPYAFTLKDVRASVGTAPTGADLIVDINESGSSILSTKITIDAGEKTSQDASTPPVISDASLADDAEITVDIDQIGSTVAGAGLKVTLIGRRT